MADETGNLAALPDDVLSLIIVLLDSKSTSRLICTNKNFKEIWMTSPVMNIGTHGIRLGFVKKYVDYIKKIISLRPIDCSVHKVIISDRWTLVRDTWVKLAAVSNVRELVLELVTDEGDVCWLDSLLRCHSLKKLELSVKSSAVNASNLLFRIGDNMEFKLLEDLKVSNVGFWCGGLSKFVNDSCPNLECLTISNLKCCLDLEIKNSSIVKLHIDTPSIDIFSRVKVSALKLQSLTLSAPGRIGLEIHLSTPHLSTMHLGLDSLSAFRVMETMPFLNKASFLVNDQYSSSVLQELVNTVCSVEHLTVSKPLIRALAKESRFSKFSKVSDLVISTKRESHLFYGYFHARDLAYFLCRFPNLKHLGIKGCPTSFHELLAVYELSLTMNTDSWESMNLEFIHELKTVQLDFCGTQDEVEFVNYLLKNASALEKCVVKYTSDVSPSSQRYTMLEMFKGMTCPPLQLHHSVSY